MADEELEAVLSDIINNDDEDPNYDSPSSVSADPSRNDKQEEQEPLAPQSIPNNDANVIINSAPTSVSSRKSFQQNSEGLYVSQQPLSPVTPMTPDGYETKQPSQIELQSIPTTTMTMPAYTSADNNNIKNMIIGKYYEFEADGKVINLRLRSIGDVPKDTTTADLAIITSDDTTSDPHKKERTMSVEEIKKESKRISKLEKRENILNLMPDSTNAWLYVRDSYRKRSIYDEDDGQKENCCNKCTENFANRIIAFAVIILQLAAYILMTSFLREKRLAEYSSREESCYGPNCEVGYKDCMDLTTGGLMSVLLIGFLWADVVNTLSICRKQCRWFFASFFVLAELITAIVCGFLVGLYSENDFDAIGGAVGILFIHDLDEKVFASMQVFRGSSCATLKKLIAVALWITMSVGVAVLLACKYEDGSYFNTIGFSSIKEIGEFQCKELEYRCASDTTCIWEGFVCNGVQDCSDGSDEGILAQCDYSLENYCPDNKPFQCIEDGSCLEVSKKCDGVIDCPEGSDEGRSQNCAEVIRQIDCGEMNITDLYPNSNNTYNKKWSGNFKCSNGQCIDAQYACDGQAGDCVDGSDEYPYFYQANQYPLFIRSCPYDKLIECKGGETLCKIDGQCISKLSICDGINDCSDGADEALCEYDCSSKVQSYESFQCGGNIAVINTSTVITFFDETSVNYSSVLAQNTIQYFNGKEDISHLFANVTGECIPIQWRCDGTNDCDDGSDEKQCSLLTCGDSEYQCSDSGACIPKSWLCDGTDDCPNAQDENSTVCEQNGVSASGNACIQQGFDYQCENYASICLYSYQLCNGLIDCPFGDDETDEICDEINNNSTELACNEIFTGYDTAWTAINLTFTLPVEYTDVKITSCVSGNDEGFSGIILREQGTSFYSYDLVSNSDYLCSCSYRSTLLGSVDKWDNITSFPITPGTIYDAMVYLGFTGNYAFEVECGNSLYSYGASSICEESDDSDTPTSITDYTDIYCDEVVTGTLSDAEIDYYRFVTTDTIYFDGCASRMDTVMEIYEASDLANYVAENDEANYGQCESYYGQSYVTLPYDSSYGGYYYLAISPWSSPFYTVTDGNYSFIFGCGLTTTAPRTTQTPSYNYTNFTACNQTLTGSIAGGFQLFRFMAYNAGSMYIDACGSNFNTYLEIYEYPLESFVYITSNDNGINGTCTTNPLASYVTLPYDPLYFGYYVLVLYDFGGLNGGNYSLTLGCD